MKRFSAEERRWFSWLHQLPCVVTGVIGEQVQAAHIRSAQMLDFNKPNTGTGQKPDFPWCLPLLNSEHDKQHAMGSERAYWESVGMPIDCLKRSPLLLCNELGGFYRQNQLEAAFERVTQWRS